MSLTQMHAADSVVLVHSNHTELQYCEVTHNKWHTTWFICIETKVAWSCLPWLWGYAARQCRWQRLMLQSCSEQNCTEQKGLAYSHDFPTLCVQFCGLHRISYRWHHQCPSVVASQTDIHVRKKQNTKYISEDEAKSITKFKPDEVQNDMLYCNNLNQSDLHCKINWQRQSK